MRYNAEKLTGIDLGRQGENLARTIEIDVSAMLAQWPEASISLLVKRKHDADPYVANTEVRDGMLYWPITAADTASAGDGKIELRAVCGEVLAKSATGTTRVTASLTGSETEPPAASQGWVDQVLEAGSNAQASAEEARTAADQAQSVAETLAALKAEAITTAPGTDAKVEVSDGVITYSIPRGDVGPQGPQGIQGLQGKPGIQGVQGDVGPQGEAGYTPVRGTDYWTADDQAVVDAAKEATQKALDAAKSLGNAVQDVRINGASIVDSGVANVPIVRSSIIGHNLSLVKGKTYDQLGYGEYGSNSAYKTNGNPPVFTASEQAFWNNAAGAILDIAYREKQGENATPKTLEVRLNSQYATPRIEIYYVDEKTDALVSVEQIENVIADGNVHTYDINPANIAANTWLVRFVANDWIGIHLCRLREGTRGHSGLIGTDDVDKLFMLSKVATSGNYNDLSGTPHAATENDVEKRLTNGVLTLAVMDEIVKTAMCDGIGEAWTPDEQTAARDRLGQEEINRDRERRLTNLEYAAKGYLYREETDASATYEKVLPGDVCPWATLDKIGGRTLAWSQLLNHNFDDRDFWKSSGPQVEEVNGVLTQTPSNENQIMAASPREAAIGFTIGHIYAIAVDYKTGHDMRPVQINSGTTWHYTNAIKDNRWHKSILIVALEVDVLEEYGLRFGQSTAKEGFSSTSVKNPMIFDLTQMFGAGNEPTAEQFSAMFPADYYPYSEPTLMSFSGKEVINKGKNLLNIAGRTEIIDTGSHPVDSARDLNENQIWVGVSSNNHFTEGVIKNYNVSSDGTIAVTRNSDPYAGYGIGFPVQVLPGYRYYQASTCLNGIVIYALYDAEGRHIGAHTPSTTPLLITEFCRWIMIIFRVDAANATGTFSNNILTFSEDTSYIPYRSPVSLPTEAIVQKYFPDGMKSAGSVHDEIDLERGVAIQNIAAIDLGSLSWTYDAINYRMFSDGIAQTVKKPRVEDNWGDHLSCAEYLPMIWNESKDKFVTLLYTGRIYVKDARYSDAAAFKEAVSGIVLYYELAEPIETPITEELPADIEIEAGGSLTFVNDQGEDFRVPVSNQQTWLIKLGGAN